MQYPSALIALFAATAVLSIPVPKPLNINMGAYSPALVVGDGAIGFKGTQSVAALMNTLEGAATNSAVANGAAAPAAAVAPTGITQAGVVEQAPAASATPEVVAAQGELPQGMGKMVVTRDVDDEEELDLEELYAEVDKRLTPEEELEIEEDEDAEDAEDVEKRDLTAEEQAEIDEDVEEEDAE